MCNCTCIRAGLSASAEVAQIRPDDNPKALVTIENEPMIGESPQRAFDSWLTPNPLFYVRNHFDIPDIRCSEWKLHVDGVVSRDSHLTLDELKELPRVTLPVTMECAGNNRSDLDPPTPGNQFQNGAISTAYWAGVPLKDVLAIAGIGDGAREVLFEGHDSGVPAPGEPETPYLRSLPIDVATHPDTLLVYEMNGCELPKEHGHPLRLMVPGWYGMASVKWLKRITVLDFNYEGFFQTDRYIIEDETGDTVPLTSIGIKSVIGSPAEGDVIQMGGVCVKGTAWSGGERISAVDVSCDGGDSWERAEVFGPSERYAWQHWRYCWSPPAPGEYTLMSRAVDACGNVQPMETRWNRLGYMVNGVRPVKVAVVP